MKRPLLTIEMETGKVITIELFPDTAPNSVHSVIALANKGLYDGRNFYRVVRDFVIQADCEIRGGYEKGCDYIIDGEYRESGYMVPQPKFTKYMVGLAGMGRNSNISSGSAFFIMTGEYDSLDGDFAVIGKVTGGFEEVDRINNVACHEKYYGKIPFYTPKKPEVIRAMKVECFGVAYPLPVTKPYTQDYKEKEDELNALID